MPARFRLFCAALVGVVALGCAAAGQAQNLRIALGAEPTAVDPHYHDQGPNNALATHIFDALVGQDENQRLAPSLATAWRNDGQNRWTFELRQGVTFSNGQPFTADDVIFTFCRVLNNETAVAGGFSDLVRNISAVEAPNPHTLIITTVNPEPLLPVLLSDVRILTRSIVQHGPISFTPTASCGVTSPWPTVSQFNDGSMAIGTGPYRLKSYVRGSAIELARSDTHWGGRAPWAEVRFVPVPSAGPRLAGLLAGDYDVIENPAARDLGRLRNDQRFGHVITPSTRVIFLQLDVGREPSPFVRAERGNPLQDPRVRQAMSLAIDREAIVRRIMDGAAASANQFLPTGMFGTLPNPPALRYDPAAARNLLREAGYPNGFQITLSATNDRYINDGQIAQAVAQYLTQVGIRTEVDAMTRAIFFPRRARREFSFAMGGWGSGTGEAASFLRQWVATPNAERTLGGSNYGGFSDPAFDTLIRQAVTTLDDERRAEFLRQAGVRALEGGAFIPLHFESTIWAYRANLAYVGRVDQYTLAMSVRPAR